MLTRVTPGLYHRWCVRAADAQAIYGQVEDALSIAFPQFPLLASVPQLRPAPVPKAITNPLLSSVAPPPSQEAAPSPVPAIQKPEKQVSDTASNNARLAIVVVHSFIFPE